MSRGNSRDTARRDGEIRRPLEDSRSAHRELPVPQDVCVEECRLLFQVRGESVVVVGAQRGCAEGSEYGRDPLLVLPPALGGKCLSDAPEQAKAVRAAIERARHGGGGALELLAHHEGGRGLIDLGGRHECEQSAAESHLGLYPEKRERPQELPPPFVGQDAEHGLVAAQAGGGIASDDVDCHMSVGWKKTEVAAPRNASLGQAKGDEFVRGAFFVFGGQSSKRQLPAGVVTVSPILEGHDEKEAAYFCYYASPAGRNARESYLSADAVSNVHSIISRWFSDMPALPKSPWTYGWSGVS